MAYPNRDKLIAKAKELREGGLSHKKIADRLGVKSAGTIVWWLSSPKRKEEEKARANNYYAGHKNEFKERHAIYYQKNKEELLAYNKIYHDSHKAESAIYEARRDPRVAYKKEYRLTHKEEARINRKAYRDAHKEKELAYSRAYHKAHRIEGADAGRMRRSKVRSGVPILRDEYNAIWEEQGGRCFYCGEPMVRSGDSNADDYYNVDHVNPFDNGGFHMINNAVYACRKCNSNKSNKLIEDWKPEILPKIAENPRLRYDIEEAHMRWLV